LKSESLIADLQAQKNHPKVVYFCFGGGGGNRTRVRKSSAFSSTCLFHLLI